MYIDHYQSDPKLEPVTIGGFNTLEKIYNYNPTPASLIESGKDHHVLGVRPIDGLNICIQTTSVNTVLTHVSLP